MATWYQAAIASNTDGNLFNTVNFTMSTNGNSKPYIKPGLLLKAGALHAGAGIAVYLMAGRKNQQTCQINSPFTQ